MKGRRGQGNKSMSAAPASPRHTITRCTMLLPWLSILLNQVHAQPTQPPTSPLPTGTSSISGHAFFDSTSDGTKDPDNSLDYGIYDISFWLFNCDNELLKTTKSDTSGNYILEGLPSGEYYIDVQIASYYMFTEVWNGATGEGGELLYPEVDSDVDPLTGRTECFNLEEGEDTEVKVGLQFYVAPVDPPGVDTNEPTPVPIGVTLEPTPGVTPEPTNIPTNLPTPLVTPQPTIATVVTSSPTIATVVTSSPTIATVVTNSPSIPPVASTSSPVESTPPPVTPAPTSSPSGGESVTIGGYAFEDTNNNGYFEQGEGLLNGVTATLISCSPDDPSVLESVATTSTDNAGFYRFENLGSGYYYVNFDYCVEQIGGETCYTGSDIWNGLTDSTTGELLAEDADSYANPETGSTLCVLYGEGEFDNGVSVGMRYVTTESPTLAPSTGEPTVKYTEKPSVDETYGPSVMPSVVPTYLPSVTPSLPPTSSLRPSLLPSFTPSRAGEEYGPVLTERLVMTLRGIDNLENVDDWTETTAIYIEYFFNVAEWDEKNKGAFDVEADLSVTNLISSDERLVFTRARKRRLQGCSSSNVNVRVLQTDEGVKYVQVTYNQLSTYKTSDPQTYNDIYVATAPFSRREDQEAYMAALQALSPYYNDVTSVGSIRVDPPPTEVPPPVKATPPEDDEEKKDNNMVYIIVGAVCGLAVLVAALVLIMYRRRSRRKRDEFETVGNGPQSPQSQQSSRQQFDDDKQNDLESESSASSASDVSVDNTRDFALLDRRRSLMAPAIKQLSMHGFDDAAFDLISSTHTTPAGDKILQIDAPPGKLGVIVDTPAEGGCSFICEIKDACPIRNEVRLEDKIIAVDDTDVQKMTAVDVSRLLARRSKQEVRKITILREMSFRGSSSMSEAMSGSSSVGERRSSFGGGNRRSSFEDMMGGFSEDIAGADALLGSMHNEDVSNANTLLGAIAEASSEDSELGEGDRPRAESSKSLDQGLDGTLLEVYAPAGKLGVVLVTPEPPDEGPSYVFKIRDDSALFGKLCLGDKVLAVDDEDVRDMTAINVSKLLGSKSSQKSRKITILRVPGEEESVRSISESEREYDTDDDVDRADELLGSNWRPPENAGETSAEIGEGDRIDIIAPAGKLGVVVDSPAEGGSAYVSEVKDESPIADQIRLGDKIIMVDGEDVSTLKAIHVSMLLGSKSRNPSRRITILRAFID